MTRNVHQPYSANTQQLTNLFSTDDLEQASFSSTPAPTRNRVPSDIPDSITIPATTADKTHRSLSSPIKTLKQLRRSLSGSISRTRGKLTSPDELRTAPDQSNVTTRLKHLLRRPPTETIGGVSGKLTERTEEESESGSLHVFSDRSNTVADPVPVEDKGSHMTLPPKEKPTLTQRIFLGLASRGRGKPLSSHELREHPRQYGPMARFELGLIKNPHEALRGINSAFSYFHQICGQIQEVFHNRWDKISAMGTSNCANICDFGKQSVATAKYARKQLLNHINQAAGRGHDYPSSACEQHIHTPCSKNDLELYMIAYRPRTRRSLGETALMVKVGDQRIPLVFRPADGQKAKPNTGTKTNVEGAWIEAPDLIMKNNMRQLKIDAQGAQVAKLIQHIQAISGSDAQRTPELTNLLERLSLAESNTTDQQNEDDSSTVISRSDVLASVDSYQAFNAKKYHSTNAVIDALKDCKIDLPTNLNEAEIHENQAALKPAHVWETLQDECPTVSGMPQLQSPMRADLARFGWRVMSMQMASDMAGMASDMLDAMMQFRKSLEEFKGHEDDLTHPLDIFHPLPVPDAIVGALKSAPLPSALTSAIKTLPTPQKIKTLADSFERLDHQLTTVTLDGLSKVTGQRGFVKPGERIMPRPQDITTDQPATVKVKLITHPPRSLTSTGQTALAFEVKGELVHAVGYRPALGKARRWTGILGKEKLSLTHMRPLLRKQNLKVMDLDLNEEQTRALLEELNQQRANLTNCSDLFLPQVGHIRIDENVIDGPQATQLTYSRSQQANTGNDVDHIRHLIEQANIRLSDTEGSEKICIPHEIRTPGTTSRTLANRLSKHQQSLYDMHYPEHLTLRQKIRFLGNFKRSFQQFEVLATQVMGELDKCLRLTESLMKDLPEAIEPQIRALTSTPLTPRYPEDGKPVTEQSWTEYLKSFLPYGMNIARGLIGQQQEDQTPIPLALYESARATAKAPAAWEHLRTDLNGLTETIDSIKNISEQLWKPIVENVPETKRMEDADQARKRIKQLGLTV